MRRISSAVSLRSQRPLREPADDRDFVALLERLDPSHPGHESVAIEINRRNAENGDFASLARQYPHDGTT
jgi:hypothetical protein